MDLKQEIFKRIDAIAEKLGVASAYLWHILVKQAIADGIGDALSVVICLILGFVGISFIKKFHKMTPNNDWDDEGPVIGLVVSSILTPVLFLVAAVVSIDAVKELINPEYYALQTLLQALK